MLGKSKKDAEEDDGRRSRCGAAALKAFFERGVRRSKKLLLKVLNGCCLPCQLFLLQWEGVAAATTMETPAVRG